MLLLGLFQRRLQYRTVSPFWTSDFTFWREVFSRPNLGMTVLMWQFLEAKKYHTGKIDYQIVCVVCWEFRSITADYSPSFEMKWQRHFWDNSKDLKKPMICVYSYRLVIRMMEIIPLDLQWKVLLEISKHLKLWTFWQHSCIFFCF